MKKISINKEGILQKKKEYIKVASTLSKLRPLCHFASAFTTVCFLVLFVSTRDFARPYYEGDNSTVFYILTIALASALGYYFEKRFSEVVDAFGTVVADGYSKYLTLGVFAILIPLFAIAASTSFIGAESTAVGTASSEGIEYISDLSSSLSSNSKDILKERREREERILKNREGLRESIIEEYDQREAAIPEDNKKLYPRFWESRSYTKKCKEDKRSLKLEKTKELREFDSETDKIIQKLNKKVLETESSEAAASKKALETASKATEDSINKMKVLGSFFGLVAVIAIFISILSSVMSKKIYNIINEKK